MPMTPIIPSTVNDYYMSPYAVIFILNALGDADTLSVSVYANAKVVVYRRDAIGYNPDNNYRQWTIVAYNTHFDDSLARYCHLAVSKTGDFATIVYPSCRLDLFGREISEDGMTYTASDGKTYTRNEEGLYVDSEGKEAENIEDEDQNNWYIFLGKITSSKSGARSWDSTYPLRTGNLDTDQYRNDINVGAWEKMFHLNEITNLIEQKLPFAKIILGATKKVVQDIWTRSELSKEASYVEDGDANETEGEEQTETEDDKVIPSVSFLRGGYISKLRDSEVKAVLKFLKYIDFGQFVSGMVGGSGGRIDSEGNAELKSAGFREQFTVGKFVTGISGQGAKIDKKGDAEVQNLRVWKSMTVTELRFDRASVLLGTNIQTYCGGVIKKVEITGENTGFIDLETDEEANGEIEGGIGSVQNGALCVGYYHDIKGGNDTDDADDFKGTIKYKGTKCVQFAIDWKEEGETGYSPADLPNATTTRHIRYELREGTTQHPVEGMTFKGTGNMKDPSLGYFAISTPKYTAKYAFVTSWEWDAAQCIVEVGGADISGFGSIVGETWTSPQPGTICTNLYTRGVITQASSDKRYLYVTQDSNGMLKPGESEKITMVVRDSYFHNRTQEFSFKLNGETVENLGEEAVAHVSFEELDDEVNEFVITATDGKKHLVEQTIKIRKLLDGLRLDAGKAAIGEELTASVLRYHGTTRVTNGYLWYEIDNGGLVAYTEGSEVRLASTNKSITFFWYEDEMRLKLIAKLELPLVKNGEDGKDGTDGESAYVIITDREVVKPDEESTLVYFDGFKAAVQWDGGAPVGVTNESIVVRACRCRGNKESVEGSFIYRLDGGEAHAMTNGGSVTVEKKSGIKSVTFCWMADNGAMLAQKIVYVVLDGEAPVFADLDNEMDSIVTDKDGNFEGSVTLSTNVAMYHGLTKLSPTITAATATGITSKVDGGRVSFTVTQAAADRNEMDITLTAVIEDVTYTRHLTFTIVKQRKGNTGDPAVVYSLAPSYSAIKVDKYGNRLVKSIVCNVAKTTGKDERVLLDSLPEGMKVKWQMDDSSSVSSSSTIPTINVSAVKNQLVLMLDYDGTVIDRETIPVMSDAVESFKEMVFKRLSEKPSKPSGGTFANPIPTGWDDGIPSGEAQVWTSSRTFYSDNRSTADWTDPVQLSDTADFDVCYHADEAKPTLLPTSHHTEDQGNGWHNTATEKDWWMATDIKKNGVWQGWKVSRIKGEKGNSFDEAKYYFKSTPRGANTPSVSLSNGVPDGWSTNIAETHWGEKVSNDFHYWLWQVIVETVMDNVGNKTYKAQSAQMIDEYDPKKTGVAETYCANNDANNHPSGWTDLSSARASFGKEKPYLWKRERRTYSDGSIEDFYSIFDKYVENGKSAYEIWLDNGNEGTEADFLKTLNGRAVAKVEEYYGVSSYPSTQPAIWYEASKFDKKSHNESNRYLWNKERTFDQDEKLIVETTPVVIAIWTKDGRGIKSITEHYLATSADSGVTTSTYGWDIYTKMSPTDKYLWNYETITYTEGSPANTDPVIIGVYGDKGDPGDPGKQGLQGLIVRTGEWVSGAHYRCDEGVDCGFLDVVLIKNDSSETGWDAYKCIKEHDSSSINSPTSSSSSEYWQRMYNIGALFTSLIIAKYAKLTFAQANQLLLENVNSVVTGGLSGGSNIQIWAGSDGMNGNTPNNPKFYVTSEGEMYAQSGIFEGSIKTKFVKNGQNINVNNSDKVEATGEYRYVKLPNGKENVGREVTIYNSVFNQTRVPSETVITVNGSGDFMGAKVKECSSYGSVYSPTKYANEIHFWGGIVKLIALPDTATTCLWMVMFVNVEGGSYVYNNGNSADYAVRDINDASSVNGLRLASGKTAGDEGNTIYFVTE